MVKYTQGSHYRFMYRYRGLMFRYISKFGICQLEIKIWEPIQRSIFCSLKLWRNKDCYSRWNMWFITWKILADVTPVVSQVRTRNPCLVACSTPCKTSWVPIPRPPNSESTAIMWKTNIRSTSYFLNKSRS